MADLFRGLDEDCGACGRKIGDHTLREFNACGGETMDLPYEDVPEDARAMTERLGLPEGVIVVDNVVVKSMVATTDTVPRVVVPIVLHDFSVSPDVGRVIASVAFIGDTRRYGRLVRDTANGAANAAERAR